MTSLQLTLSLAPLPTGVAQDANQYGQLLVSNLSATLNGDILQGQTGGQQPINNIGPWFDGTQWWFWDGNDGVYLPQPFPGTVYNVVGNPMMQVMQRVIPATPVADNTYVMDRFKYRQNLVNGRISAAQTAIGYSAGVDYPHTRYALRITCTQPEPVVAATEYAYLTQFIQSGKWRSMTDKPTAFSVLMTASVAGTYYIALRNMDASWTYTMPCKVTAANVPHRFEFNNIPAFPAQTGSWGNVSEVDFAYEIMVILMAGVNYSNAVPRTWNGTNQICGADQINFFNTVNATLDFTLLQHQPGATVTPFIWRSFADDLWDCQEFFCKSYDYGTAPGSVTQAGGIVMFGKDSATLFGTLRYPRKMRVAPNLTIYSTNTGAAAKVFDVVFSVDRTVTSVTGTGEKGFSGIVTSGLVGASSGFAGGGQFHFAADADA